MCVYVCARASNCNKPIICHFNSRISEYIRYIILCVYAIPLSLFSLPLGQSETADHLHIAAQNPISVFSMQLDASSVHYTDFSDFYPPAHGLWKPRLSLVSLGGSHAGKALLHEADVSAECTQVVQYMYVLL